MSLIHWEPTLKSKCSLKVMVGGVAGELWLLRLGFMAPRELCFWYYEKEMLSKPDFRLNASLELHAE